MANLLDDELAARYGAHAGFQTEAGPVRTEYHGESPVAEMERLLRLHTRPDSRVLDIGCGAGQTICRLAPVVEEAWGLDQDVALLGSARRRVAAQGLTNVTLVAGNVASPSDADQLPDARFDLALSQRGPHINTRLVHKLRDGAFFIQELVGEFDGYPLREIFGRRNYAAYWFTDQQDLLGRYAEFGLAPVSTREFFYEQFFQDADHLAAYLAQGASLRVCPKSQRRANRPSIRWIMAMWISASDEAGRYS